MTDLSAAHGTTRAPTSAQDQPDPVLQDLHAAEEHYRAALSRMTQQQAEVDQLRDELARAGAQVQELRQVADHERERTEALSSALGHIHKALFGGSTYELVLKACINLTGATRGAYLATVQADQQPRVQASVDLDLRDGDAVTQFVREQAEETQRTEQVSILNDLADTVLQPPEVRALRNCVVAPVILRSALDGVIIVAARTSGHFSDQDAEALVSVGNHAAVALHNARLQREVQDSHLALVGVLADAMAAHDAQHREGLPAGGRAASQLARQLGLTEYQQSLVFYAMQLRDVGNIGVSDGVLRKPGLLLDVERELIRAHAQIGHDLLIRVPLLEDVARIVRHHHEHVDGSGYPDGLRGENIPVEARIVAVLDAYSAMLAPRSYRSALSPEQARHELQRCAGNQFDPQVVEAFLSLVSEQPTMVQPEQTQMPTPILRLPAQINREEAGLAAS
jgi:HD-GYP domain-containing protein (c-di-GMP phosphodiesterase class II)